MAKKVFVFETKTSELVKVEASHGVVGACDEWSGCSWW
jgi:hypothetical protein